MPPVQLDTLLHTLLSHDNAARQQAERELKKLAKQPQAAPNLLEAAGKSTSAQVSFSTIRHPLYNDLCQFALTLFDWNVVVCVNDTRQASFVMLQQTEVL